MGRGHAYSQSENSLAVTTGLGLNQSAVLVKQQQQHSALRIYLRSSERPSPGHEFFFFFLYNNKNCIEEHGDKQGWRARSTKRFTTERTRGNGARV